MADKKTILIVEDELMLLNALREKLTHEGFYAIEAKNGEQGLDIALRKHPDLILLDIIMPVMDGMAMLKKLRGDKWGKEAKIIMLTNLSAVEKDSAQGDYEYLVKSDWKIEDVVAKVKEALGKQAPRQAAGTAG